MANHRKALRPAWKQLVPKAALAGGIKTYAEVVEHNEPAAAICQTAERFDANLICMAVRKRSRLYGTLFGSVSQDVMARSGRPILIARNPRRASANSAQNDKLPKNGG